MKTTAQDQLTSTIERLIEKIENNDGKWIKPFNSSMPSNYKNKNMYQGINILNLWIIAEEENYSTNNWATFKQIKELGGAIKKGEKATLVFFFKPIRINELNEATGERELKTIPMLKTYNIWNIDQTTLEVSENDNQEILEVQDFIDRTGIEIKTSLQGAYYNPKSDYVGMPLMSSFKSSELYYGTLLHEISHFSGNEKRLNRDFSGRMKGTEEELKSYAMEELIAETCRSFLQVSLNLNTTEMEDQNALYLKSWLKPLKQDSKMLWKIFSQASRAHNYLMELVKEEEQAA